MPAKAGWVIRDDRGTFIGAGQAIGKPTNSCLESELQALIMAMQNCWGKGYKKILFEGDNKEIEEILNGNKANFGAYNWIREVSAWRKRFEECRFVWTRRDCNMVADTLAKGHLPTLSQFYFHAYVPYAIVNTLHCDFVTSNA
ncbi:unnamed protein product [Arabidopsis lyrata]|uniref:Predicted protein n=2 Tax=Arabidopsis lyrata subsp. lyrata TaxID=81972 RepID=D7KZP9_ARALL|nr:predicted protein [Arabidopsis lyrata subsp. lyrata]CAH8260185.1 unnamed protein product [Arabidopsis lyrata]